MEFYIKDGIIKSRTEIVLKTEDIITYNPTNEQLLENGWTKYIQLEPTEEELLEQARLNLKESIIFYDNSNSVNEFTIQGINIWLDKSTRAGLMLRFQAEEAIGKTTTTLWYGKHQFELSIKDAKGMLYHIEVYASQCYDNTQKHLAELDNLKTIEEIESYDFRTGYPEKLIF